MFLEHQLQEQQQRVFQTHIILERIHMSTHIPEEVAPHLSLDSIPQSLQFLVPNLVATVLNKANMQHL